MNRKSKIIIGAGAVVIAAGVWGGITAGGEPPPEPRTPAPAVAPAPMVDDVAAAYSRHYGEASDSLAALPAGELSEGEAHAMSCQTAAYLSSVLWNRMSRDGLISEYDGRRGVVQGQRDVGCVPDEDAEFGYLPTRFGGQG